MFDDFAELCGRADVRVLDLSAARGARGRPDGWRFPGDHGGRPGCAVSPGQSELIGRTITAGGARYVDGDHHLSVPPPSR